MGKPSPVHPSRGNRLPDIQRRKVRLKPAQEAGVSVEAYANWRHEGLTSSFHKHFSPAEVAGKRVLDFGCGFGDMSRLAAELGARQVIGVDIDPTAIERASNQPQANVTFILNRMPPAFQSRTN